MCKDSMATKEIIEEEEFEQFEILNNFKSDKVTITLKINGCTVVKTYTKFIWDTDVDCLVLSDEGKEEETLIIINFDDILEVEEENEDLIKIELESGDVTIILDTDYSRCTECHTHRPTHYIRPIGEESDEYDIKYCTECLDKILFGK